MFVPFFLNNYRLTGLLDSGSDLCIIASSVIEKLGLKKLVSSEVKTITTFSGNSIPVIGKVNCLIKFNMTHQGITVVVFIINDIANIPTVLLGNSLLQAGVATLGYTGTPPPEPTVIFTYPEVVVPTVYFETSENTHECTALVSLEPYEEVAVEMYLNSAAQVMRKDFILISGCCIGEISVLPSRTDLIWDENNDCYVGTACVINMTGRNINNKILRAKFEIINNFDAIQIENNPRDNLKSLVAKYPLGREILPGDDFSSYSIPAMEINSITAENGSLTSVSDSDLSEAIYANEPEYTGIADLSHEIIEPSGVDIPTMVYETAEDAVQLHKFPKPIQPFIRGIFIERFPQVVSLHSLDAGNLSLTLGFTQLRLRKGEALPRSRRIFHVSPGDQRHLDDITDLLCKFGYIRRSPSSPTGHHLYGMSSYLIPRAKPGCLGRLIIDYSPVNQLIESPASVIPEVNHTLQFLKSKALFSALDLRQAYLALRIDKESQPLTTFLTPSASFQWLSLPTGAANSPAHFSVAIDKILNNRVVYDENGKPIFEEPNVVKLERDVLTDTLSYFDDIIVTGTLCNTYEETLRNHFANLEMAISRLAFHGAKISVAKCEFAKSSILFLGWYVTKDYVIADPRRIKKVEEYSFPTNKKSMRAFLGLINSLRKVVPLDVIKHITTLTPLTSAKTEFAPIQKHHDAFEKLKSLLTTQPLYCNLIDEKAEKFLWVDAATSSGVLGAVLAQRIVGDNGQKILPDYLDLNDPVHQILFDQELPYRPCQLYTKLPINLPKPSAKTTVPPVIVPKEKLLGYTLENWHDSLFYSVLSVLAVYNCKPPGSILELRENAVKRLKSGILVRQLLDFTFHMNYDMLTEFLAKFKSGLVEHDPNLYLVHALALNLYRPIIVISTLDRHQGENILHFHETANRPPIILGLYLVENKEIFLPYFYTKNTEFKLDSLKGKINIIGYSAKCVPPGFESRSILDLEVFAILTALYSFQRLISGVKVTLLTDSRVLYYLFSSRVGDSSVKIRRWCLKLISDYPSVTLHFVKTSENLADFLTREGLPPGDLTKFSLKDMQISDIFPNLPKPNFTLLEWAQFVEDNPQYLTVNNKLPEVNKTHILAITAGLENVRAVATPLEILREKFSRANIIINQKTELTEIYAKCLASENFEYAEVINKKENKVNSYKLIFNLLMINKGHLRIYVPPSMVGILLSLTHLLGHQGLQRMLADMSSYYFPNMSSITKGFVSKCHPCFLSHKSNRKQVLGFYPVPKRAFEEVMADLCENIGNSGGYSHLLIMQCILTDFTIIIPLKSKTSNEICRAMLNSTLQHFNVEKIHTDNGPGFRSTSWLEAMSAFGIKVISSSALHPEGRGQLERLVQTVKLLLKKFLATRPDLNWEFLPYLISKVLNNTVSPKTGFKPMSMVCGEDNAGIMFLEHKIAPPHYSVKNNAVLIKQISDQIKEMVEIATENITTLRMQQNERANRTRNHKEFKKDDIVFVLDRSMVEGNAQVLRTKFSPSPYVVITPSFTTTVVRRLADGFQTLYSNADLKLYKKFDPVFNNLPKEVQKVLMFDFKDFLAEDFSTITKHDNLELPTSLDLFVPDENFQDDEENIEQNSNGQINAENRISDSVAKLDTALKNLPSLQEPEDEFASAVTDNITPNLLPPINSNSDPSSESEEEDDPNVRRLRYGRQRRVAFDPTS